MFTTADYLIQLQTLDQVIHEKEMEVILYSKKYFKGIDATDPSLSRFVEERSPVIKALRDARQVIHGVYLRSLPENQLNEPIQSQTP